MVYLSIKGVKNIMTNYTQLYKEDRDSIEELLKKGYSFTDIAKEIKKDRTTISKEIRRNRIIRSSFFTLFNRLVRKLKIC